ncbi:MAG: hypothetical protein ACK4NC_02445 [Candidatus Gracilibacteria bacterium]
MVFKIILGILIIGIVGLAGYIILMQQLSSPLILDSQEIAHPADQTTWEELQTINKSNIEAMKGKLEDPLKRDFFQRDDIGDLHGLRKENILSASPPDTLSLLFDYSYYLNEKRVPSLPLESNRFHYKSPSQSGTCKGK